MPAQVGSDPSRSAARSGRPRPRRLSRRAGRLTRVLRPTVLVVITLDWVEASVDYLPLPATGAFHGSGEDPLSAVGDEFARSLASWSSLPARSCPWSRGRWRGADGTLNATGRPLPPHPIAHVVTIGVRTSSAGRAPAGSTHAGADRAAAGSAEPRRWDRRVKACKRDAGSVSPTWWCRRDVEWGRTAAHDPAARPRHTHAPLPLAAGEPVRSGLSGWATPTRRSP